MRGRLTCGRWVVVAFAVAAIVAAPGEVAGQSDQDSIEQTGDIDGIELAPGAAVGGTDAVGAPNNPTEVAIAVWVEQVLGIDERNSLFEVDATLRARWVDKRVLEACASTRVHTGERAEEQLKKMWAPDFVVTDGRGPRVTTALEVTVACDGTVMYQERFSVSVTQRFTNLNDFPFDEHEIRFTVEPFGPAGKDAVRFAPLASDDVSEGRAAEKRADKFESEEWNFTVGDEASVPGPGSITTRIGIDRATSYYWINVIAPLMLIVSISWIVFWMKPVLHERIGVSITILLTVVAFDFLTGDSLPRLPFTTRIDQFYNVSYFFVVLTIVGSLVAAGRLSRRSGGHRDAGRADHVEEHHDDASTTPADDEAGAFDDESVERDEVVSPAEPEPERGDHDRSDGLATVDRIGRTVYLPAYLGAVAIVLMFGVASPGRSVVPEPVEQAVTDTLPAAPAAGVQRLGAGAVVTGRIAEPGGRDEYEVCGDTAETVSVVMRWVSANDGASLDPYLELYDLQERRLVASDDDGGGGLDSLLVLAAGGDCHLLVARDRLDEGVGDYELTVETGDSASVESELAAEFSDVEADLGVSPAELSDRAVAVDPGEELVGSIDEPGEVDAYRVCTSSDDLYVVMTRASVAIDSEFDPLLARYAENGTFVALDDDGAGGRDSLLLVPAGEECQLVVAGDRSGQMTGKYTLIVESGEPVVADDAAAAGLVDVEAIFGVSFGELVVGAADLDVDATLAASIDRPDEVQPYWICSLPGGVTSVVMARSGAASEGGIDPFLVLYAADGSFVDFDDDSAGDLDSRLQLPPGDDCFLLLAGDLSSEQTGEYQIVTSTG